MILGGIFLFVLMFQPVAEGSTLVSHAASVSKTADQRPNLDLSQLAQLDIDPVLLQFIGSVVTKVQGLENENMALQNKTQVLEAENTAVRAELAWVQNRTQILEVENKAVRAELRQVKRDKNALENKTHVEFLQEREKTTQLLIAVAKLQNKTRTNSVRLDQCEADAHPFIKEMQASQRRRLQEEETLCRGSGMIAMFAACCPSQGGGAGHRRSLQSVQGCDALPETCSASCASLFIEYFEGCQGIIDDLAPDQRQMFVGFYGGCQEVEQAAAAMLEDARPAMIFHVVVMSEAAAQQAQMFGGGSAPAPPVGPIGPLPPSPSPAGEAEIAQEFRRVCTTANLTVCVPQCNRFTYGFLLSIEIDGRGTVMTCNKMGTLFSWQGQATLGGYIGDDFQAFFSSVISGAAGTYMVTITENHDVHTDLTIEPGQVVVVSGDREGLGAAPRWRNGGFTVQERGSLSLADMSVEGGLSVRAGGGLALQSCVVSHSMTVADASATLSGCTLCPDRGGSPFYMTVSGAVSLSLASMTVPATLLGNVERRLSAGSTLELWAVTVLEAPDAELTGTMMVALIGEDYSKTVEPRGFGAGAPVFVVSSGPCTVSDAGRCVGRPDGYLPNEECTITVGGGGGVLGPCGMFDMDVFGADAGQDYITLSGEYGGTTHRGSACPVNAALVPSDNVRWRSGDANQGNYGPAHNGSPSGYDNRCATASLCGLPWSHDGLGGGWQVCFAQ